TDSRRVIEGETLSNQTGANSGENIAHSAAGHPGIASRVIAQRPTAFSHDRATAFEQKCYRKTIAEPGRCFGARFLLLWKKPFYLARVRCEQTFAFATPEHGHFFRHNVEPVGVEHHRLLRFLNQFEDFGR